MKRRTYLLPVFVTLCLLPLALVSAQQPTPTPTPFPAQPGGDQAATPTVPVIPSTPGQPAPEETAQPQPTAPQPPSEQDQPLNPTTEILLPARMDLETLADARLESDRPDRWSGVSEASNPQLALLIRFDLELLAGTLLGRDVRPEGWFGVVRSTPYAIARDIRHDLELLVDEIGYERPENWSASDPLMRCNRATQALVRFLEDGDVFTLQADRTAPNFCQQAEIEVSRFVEMNYLSDSANMQGALTGSGINAPDEPRIVEEDAVSYLDLAGTVQQPPIPVGERIEPVARSNNGTNLMLVRGIRFELFVDYRDTSVSQQAYEALPDAGGLRVTPRCQADWCSG